MGYIINITGTLENCSCNFNKGDTITNDVIITALPGYEFAGRFTYDVDDWTYDLSNKNSYLIIPLIYIEGNIEGDIDLNDNYIATKPVEKISNFANLYFTNNDELNKLAKVRFVNVTNSNSIDHGNFIINLYKTPFPIDKKLLADTKTNIILGSCDSNVASTCFITYKTEVDGGTITVPEKYKNVYDYFNTECILHLPFFNKIFLNTEYVIGQTLTIKYIIDLYTGNVTTNIYSSFVNDNIIETQTQQIAENIPFIQKQNNSVVGTISNINKNVIKTAYIEIVRNIPYNSENVFGKETIDYGIIGSHTGYIRVSDVVLQTTATIDEKEEITQLLKEGVFL